MSYLPSLLEIIEKSNLHGGLRQVYVALVAYAERYGAPISPSLTALAKASDISRRQVIRCLQQLVRQGYVTRIRRHDPRANAKNLYLVQCPWKDEKSLLKTGDMAMLKTGDTRARVGFKTQDKREKKEQTGDIPPDDTTWQTPPEVLNYPNRPERFLTPGSAAYAAALSDATPPPVPVVATPGQAGDIFQRSYAQDVLEHALADGSQYARFEVVVLRYLPAALGGL